MPGLAGLSGLVCLRAGLVLVLIIILIGLLALLVAAVVVGAAGRSRVSSPSPTSFVAPRVVVPPFAWAPELGVKLTALFRGMVIFTTMSAVEDLYHPSIATCGSQRDSSGGLGLVLTSHLVCKPFHGVGQGVFGLAVIIEGIVGLPVQVSIQLMLKSEALMEEVDQHIVIEPKLIQRVQLGKCFAEGSGVFGVVELLDVCEAQVVHLGGHVAAEEQVRKVVIGL